MLLCCKFAPAQWSNGDRHVVKMLNQKVLREKLGSWEAKTTPRAPLSEKQKDSFMELTAVASNRALPKEVCAGSRLERKDSRVRLQFCLRLTDVVMPRPLNTLAIITFLMFHIYPI